MKSIDHLTKLANRFERKILLAQKAVVAGDIEDILTAAGLFKNQEAVVSPIISAAGIPDTSSVALGILVDSKLNISFPATISPDNVAAASKLNKLLIAKYAAAMKKALVDAKVSVTDTMQLRWLTF